MEHRWIFGFALLALTAALPGSALAQPIVLEIDAPRGSVDAPALRGALAQSLERELISSRDGRAERADRLSIVSLSARRWLVRYRRVSGAQWVSVGELRRGTSTSTLAQVALQLVGRADGEVEGTDPGSALARPFASAAWFPLRVALDDELMRPAQWRQDPAWTELVDPYRGERTAAVFDPWGHRRGR